MKNGVFVISLDFELHWGVSDHFSPEEYSHNLKNTRKAIDGILQIFDDSKIHCTWATVGMLFCEGREEIFSYVPMEKRPRFENPKLSNYYHAEHAGENEQSDPFHFAPSVIKKINGFANQEISTHTFSHYYCLEKPVDSNTFAADIEAAVKVAEKNKYTIRSIVFPRNQVSLTDLEACKRNGIDCYRGTQPTWFHKPVTQKSEKQIWKRVFRLLDHYVNITGYNGYDLEKIEQAYSVINIPQSRFLRPYSKKLSLIEPFRIRRIKNEMTDAAKKGKMYQLWWHPHNFGNDVEENINVLKQLIEHYKGLERKYKMRSMTMTEVFDNYFKKS